MRDLREHLVGALTSDLIGPFTLEADSREVLPVGPLRWYQAGFLAPAEAGDIDASLEEAEEEGGDEEEGDGKSAGTPAEPKAPRRLPSSIGVSVLLPPGEGAESVEVTVGFAQYVLARGKREKKGEGSDAGDGRGAAAPLSPGAEQAWTREPVGPLTARLALTARALRKGVEIAPGLWVEGLLGQGAAHGLEEGTRALTVFLVNRRPVAGVTLLDAACVFQVELAVRFERGLVARRNRRDEGSMEWDEKVADLQFRDKAEWAVGHAVAAVPIHEGGRVVGARTTWLPRAEVTRVEARKLGAVTTGMRGLAALSNAESVRRAMGALPEAYGTWIADQRAVTLDTELRRETRDVLLHEAERARERIARGIELLATDGEVRRAFCLANEAMALAAKQRDPERYVDAEPAWRLFQLAFVLMNLAAMADPRSDERAIVDLIFFPTGGGKTEAYLGLIAFTLILRRLRGAKQPSGGLGVAILLRYTLRLLTLDQLGRGATLVCALETMRRGDVAEGATVRTGADELGEERFAIGLWVGKSATANTMREVMDQLTAYKKKSGPTPFPLPECPWCKRELTPGCFHTKGEAQVVASCANIACPFAEGQHEGGIPVLFVDESIYAELPCFLVATVDKLAMLPWRGLTAKLFGHVAARSGRTFHGAADGAKVPKGWKALPEGVPPPELIVQDELHLISGPLGTMVGLYETAIEELCVRTVEGTRVAPKIVASTATVRRAREQVQALFGRDDMMLFPPPGVNDSDTFFAKPDDEGKRLYVGVAAPGRAMKALLLHSYVALLGAAEKLYDRSGPKDQTADAYATLVGYFNSLRELGGMRRLVEGDVLERCGTGERERAPGGVEHPWVRRRLLKNEPAELTSRHKTSEIARVKSQLRVPRSEPEHIDVVLASNMISVGVDIDRLGLMVVAGQPKTTSEYIQASSRVGRAVARPGLVVTVLNVHKPRDRSHYERFGAYHESLYRFVEATSVTPFSAPALDRGLAGTLVAMTRLGNAALTPAAAVRKIAEVEEAARRAVERIADKAAREKPGATEEESRLVRDEITRLGKNLVGAWRMVVEKEAVERYSQFEESDGIALMSTALDGSGPKTGSSWAKFRAPTSMRDVEPSVHLWKSRQQFEPLKNDEEG